MRNELSVQELYKIEELWDLQAKVQGDIYIQHFNCCGDTIKTLFCSDYMEEKNKVFLAGHYIVASFDNWCSFNRAMKNVESVLLNTDFNKFFHLHGIDGTWRIIVKVY